MADNKVAMVTGAGTGVGRSAALALAGVGFDVVLAGRRKEPLEGVAREIEAAGRRALAVSADVGNPESVKALFDRTKEIFGRLDVLFNNAGVGAPGIPFEDLTYDQWQTVVAANLTGPFLCSQQAVKMFKAQSPQGGRIINNGSISATTPRPNSLPYTSTKHAISGLTKSIALDGRRFDIAASQIDIGNAATPMTARMVEGVPQADGTMAPEPRIDPAHVGQAVAYIATLPLDTNVLFMNVMATKMPFVGRG